jgi:hypothetical protein
MKQTIFLFVLLLSASVFAADLNVSDINHNDLQGLQGGALEQYFHLSESAYYNLFQQDQSVRRDSWPVFRGLSVTSDLGVTNDLWANTITASTKLSSGGDINAGGDLNVDGEAVVGEGIRALKFSTFDSTAQEAGSVAFGYGNIAEGTYSTALGMHSNAKGTGSFAAGYFSEALANKSIAMGFNSRATLPYSVAIGYNTEATLPYLVALGMDASVVRDLNVGRDLNLHGDIVDLGNNEWGDCYWTEFVSEKDPLLCENGHYVAGNQWNYIEGGEKGNEIPKRKLYCCRI